MHLCVLPDKQNQVLKKLFFSPLTCFDAFPDHQNQVIKKLFFSPLEWLKTCFDAFPDHQNQVLKKLFFNIWSGYKLVLMHILTTRIKSLKNCFSRLGWLKTCFDAFPENQNQVIKKLFFNVWF
jgi:cation transport regulator ChaB